MSPQDSPSAELLPLKPLPLSGPTAEEADRLARPVDEQLLALTREVEQLANGLRNLSGAEGRWHRAMSDRFTRMETQVDFLVSALKRLERRQTKRASKGE